MRPKQRIPQVKLYIRRNSQPGHPVTVQKQAGQASLDMTMRYFARKRNQQIHADMNRVFGTPVAVSATA